MDCYWAVLLSDGCFPLGLFCQSLISFRRVLLSQATVVNKMDFLKFSYHCSLVIFQLCIVSHFPSGKHRGNRERL